MRFLITIAALMLAVPAQAVSPIIDTVAGTGVPDDNGPAGRATEVNVGQPFGVVIGPDGALYLTEIQTHRVRRVDLTTGALTTVAGCGRKGYSGDGGPAIDAELNEPYEVRFDAAGNMLFVEMQNHLVRRVDAKTGVISTVAGTGHAGFSGDGGPATAAQFRQPHSIALDDAGAIYIADIGNHRIRRIDPATGTIDTIAGSKARALPKEGQVARGNPILGPRALFIDHGTLWIALREGNSVWRMDLADGMLHHVAGTGKAGHTGDGGAPAEATFNGPKGIAIDAHGLIYIADTENHAIRCIDLAKNDTATIAGSGPDAPGTEPASAEAIGDNGLGAIAKLNRPHGICTDAAGTLYIGDTLTHRIRRVKFASPSAGDPQ